MRPRVLCFLYYFPPSGGPGVLRGLKFVKYLPEAGFDPVVVTVAESTFENPEEYPPDPSTLGEVPPGVPVVRVPCFEPVRLKRRLERLKLMRLAQMILYPLFWERQALWPLPAIRAGTEIARREPVDLVYTCSGPYASNLIGLALGRRLGLPWVADHRDPWTQSWHLHWPSRAHHRLCEIAEDRVLRRATRFVANSPRQRDELLRRFPGARPDRVAVVPNGYDEEDFRGPPPAGDAGRFVVLHTGTFTARTAGLGPATRLRRYLRDRVEWRNRYYDLSVHSPLTLFRALAVLRERHPREYGTVEVRLLGADSESWREEARREGVEGAVTLLPPEPHLEAVGRMRAADLLFLPTTGRRDGRPVSRVSQKLYEYLRAGPPILVESGPGDARDLVLEAGAGAVVGPGDVRGMADALLRAIRGEGAGERRDQVVRRYERRRLTERLAGVFRDALRG